MKKFRFSTKFNAFIRKAFKNAFLNVMLKTQKDIKDILTDKIEKEKKKNYQEKGAQKMLF